MSQATKRLSQGFTLIEMVVVLAIVAVLVLAAQPLHELALRRTQETALRHALREVRTAIDEHRRAVERGVLATGANKSPFPLDLQSLVAGVAVLSAPGQAPGESRLYLLRRLPRDPFADPDVPAHESWGLRASTSPPSAAQAGSDVFDIHSKSELRALDGTRYRDW